MGRVEDRRRLLAACLMSALWLGGCATGQGSFVAGSGGSSDGASFVEEEVAETTFETNAPGLLAASGNALLPGGRRLSPPSLGSTASSEASLLGPGGISTGPMNGGVELTASPGGGVNATAGLTTNLAAVNANAGLLGGGTGVAAGLSTGLVSAQVNAALGGPLLTLNGSNAALLGVRATGPNVLGVTPNAAASVGTAVNPATAATQTLINATVGANTPSGPVTAPVDGNPLKPPVIGVPGTTPLQTLLPLLPTAPKPPLLPGLLGN